VFNSIDYISWVNDIFYALLLSH